MTLYSRVLDCSPAVTVHNALGEFQMRSYLVRHRASASTVLTLAANARIHNGCLVRLNSACLTSEVFGCDRCDCSWQLWESLRLIAEDGNGVLIYLPDQDGRGAGLHPKILSYAAQDRHALSTAEAFDHIGLVRDSRSYEGAIAVLVHTQISKIRLLTNSPDKVQQIEQAGIAVTCHSLVASDHRLHRYLAGKQHAFGHWIESEATVMSDRRNREQG
jgi:3,4-dihydroxy 2-butanone 4-phosphate synthase / GTP cyclohydrolase II